MTKTVDLDTSQGTIRLELDDEKGARDGEETSSPTSRTATTTARCSTASSRASWSRAAASSRDEAEAHRQSDPQRGVERPEERQVHVAMARTSDPHSATAQFFINAADNAFLDFKSETQSGWGYAVFGKVVKGSEVIDAIEQVRTGNRGGHGDVPLDDVTITRATVVS
jgi:peptidyl-prolyl cis-trans isomerase B (cyclophilin B)